MPDKNFKKAVISSFSNAKKHISSLENQIESLKSVLLRQNEIIRKLTEKILTPLQPPKNPPNSHFFNVSTGNEGVKQSINQSINQSLSTKIEEKEENNDFLSTNLSRYPSLEPKNEDFLHKSEQYSLSDISSSEEQTLKKQKILENTQKAVKTIQKDILDENFQVFKSHLNEAFSKLSKQELKVFLTVYQLDEGNQGASYTELAQKMGLTETCIRAYISSLFKKGLPLVKIKINNKKTLVSIKQDFKGLNLKEDRKSVV